MQLNDQQQAVAAHRDGPLLVLAGAGTGKTHTLTQRVYQLLEDGIEAPEILLLTFTRKAAEEMLERVKNLQQLNGISSGAPITGGTFHSLAFSFLRRFSGQNIFNLLDDKDQQQALKKFCADKDSTLPDEIPLKKILSLFSLHKNTQRDFISLGLEQKVNRELINQIAELYSLWDQEKKHKQLFDFDDMLCQLLDLLRSSKGPEIRRQFRYIMVDEFQDCTALQVEILKELCRDAANLMLVGDDCQSIYGFRGAESGLSREMPKSFPGMETKFLTDNYRSTQQILDFSNDILLNSSEVINKELRSANDSEGDEVKVHCLKTEKDIAEQTLEFIRQEQLNGTPLEKQAVLYRNSQQALQLEMRLMEQGIPYKKAGGLKIAESKHLKDFLSLLTILYAPQKEIAWLRCLKLVPAIGDKTVAKLLPKILENTALEKLTFPKKSKLFISSLQELFTIDDRDERPFPFLLKCLDWYLPLMKKEGPRKQDRKIDELNQLIYEISEAPQIEDYLGSLFLDRSSKEQKQVSDFLNLSTIHSAKGKEWQAVYLIDCSDQVFPGTKEGRQAEEELRLLYVACTRAQKSLKLLYPQSSFDKQERCPSRFLKSNIFEESFFADTETESYSLETEPRCNEPPPDDGELIYNYDDTNW